MIGYSGGKDSTTTLQLIWQALKKLSPKQLSKPIYVISSDTLVETPKIVEYVDTALGQINSAASASGLPITAHKVLPVWVSCE